MKKVLAIFFVVLMAVGLTGCGKPPKDVARNIALSYVRSMGGEWLTKDDIKYLSAYSKEGGYVVNIQAGDALCEMQMIKGDKEWMGKGISCNGQFLSAEKIAEHKKAAFADAFKKYVVSENAKGPQAVDNGGRVEKYSFDGTRLSLLLTLPIKATEFTDEMKKKITSNFINRKCGIPEAREAASVGITFGIDLNSSDGKSLAAITIGDKDCKQVEDNPQAASGGSKDGNITTDMEAFYDSIYRNNDTDIKREEHIRSLIGTKVSWRLYVKDVREEYGAKAYHIELSSSTAFAGGRNTSFETKDKKLSLSLSKGDKVTYKGTFTGRGALHSSSISKEDCSNVSLVKGWETENTTQASTGNSETGPRGIMAVTKDTWNSEVIQSKGLVAVDFWTVWSEPCKQLDPTIEEFSKEYSGKVTVMKINTDENPDVASKYKIKGVPTVIFFKDGRKVDQILGAASKATLKKKIDSLL